MTSDRELLTLAAKAAGIDYSAFHEYGHWGLQLLWHGRDGIWNPLTDDGDALRLAVQIGFYIDIERPCGQVDVGPGRAIERFQFDDLDAALVATRRAIVRAAAEIGKAVVD